MDVKTVYGKDKQGLAKAKREELLKAWHTLFRQAAPQETSSRNLVSTMVAVTSLLRLDFEIMRQRGLAFDGETGR